MTLLPATIAPARITARLRAAVPALIAASGDRASLRFLEFFAARIRNPNTRRAYGRAVAAFLAWCDDQGVPSIAAVQPLHVAAWIEMQQQEHAALTVKQRLAALRHLFDWLVTGQVMPVNPAYSVRGPSHTVKEGKTPVLAAEEARALLDSIEVTTIVGLRDRALIGIKVFSFARIGAVRRENQEPGTAHTAAYCQYGMRDVRQTNHSTGRRVAAIHVARRWSTRRRSRQERQGEARTGRKAHDGGTNGWGST